MKEQDLINWLKSQTDFLDLIIESAAQEFLRHNSSKYNFCYDLNECQKESFNLIQGRDLCYDRPNTAFSYSLWYHARRINTFLRFFIKSFLNNSSEKVEIFDLGAGTGAVQFAVALILEGMKLGGIKTPIVKIINVDSSPFMLEYNRKYLWPEFVKQYPESKNLIIEYNVNSWNIPVNQSITNPWITASYLFDISDNQELVAEDFTQIINRYKPKRLLLLSSNQPEKRRIVNFVTEKLKVLKYISEEVSLSSLPLTGDLKKVNKFRKELYEKYSSYRIDSPTNWSDGGFFGVNLTKTDALLDLGVAVNQEDVNRLDLYNPKLKIRKDIQLSSQQKKAASFLGRPSIIIGPAGSGKSVVITEKIKKIVEERSYDPNLKILLTTFNRGLIQKVGDWLNDLLKKEKFKRIYLSDYQGNTIESSKFKFSNETENIYLLNFDLLPSRIGNIKGGVSFEERQIEIIDAIIPEVKQVFNVSAEYDEILNPEFIYEEYYKIIYGRNIKDKEQYRNIPRTGMWRRLGPNQRDIVFEVIKKYMLHLSTNNIQTLITKRRQFINMLESNKVDLKFDYILIDEFQDCTETDFKMFYNLIKDVNNITFAGDLAQSTNIGTVANIPRDSEMNRIEKFFLDGSYRVPYRISECISNISDEISKIYRSNEGAQKIKPVKNSPPGSRPIVVYASSLQEMCRKVKAVWDEYSIFDLSKISILEKDNELKTSLVNIGFKEYDEVETNTILRLRGLEKDCVLWSPRIPIEDERKVHEFVYTILTRTSNILIIALSDSTNEHFKKVLNLLRPDRLILFDKETKEKFGSFCELVETKLPQEE